MNDLVRNRAQPVAKKAKKNQIKDGLDRLKQAEKKRRRLEKALATSAAIRSELEKKKQRKKEEQQKLDEEGAAIAEAVALHVLGEDADETCDGVCDKDDICGEFFRSCQIESLPCWKRPICPLKKIGWACNPSGSKFIWGGTIDDEIFPLGNFRGSLYEPENEYCVWESPRYSVGFSAAPAVPSLQTTEDAGVGSLN